MLFRTVEIEDKSSLEEIAVQTTSPDILPLNGNDEGEDETYPDIHASYELFQQKISERKPGDRILLVGDLFDRGKDGDGEDSYKIYDLIMEANKGLPPDKLAVYSARGNHEEMLIKYYELYTLKKEDPESYLDEYNKHKEIFVRNGGKWATVLESEDPKDEPKIKKLHEIVNFLQTLPYIIAVDEVKQHKKTSKRVEGYNIVHGDLPFPVEELLQRIKNNKLTLNESEKTHVTNARPNAQRTYPKTYDKFFPKRRTYCGHSIGKGVRINRRHYNLEGGVFCTGSLLSINHHKNTCELTGATSNFTKLFPDQMTPVEVKNQINYFFKVENVLGACHDFHTYLSEEKESEIITKKMDFLEIMTQVIVESESEDPLDVLQNMAGFLESNIVLLKKATEPPNPEHDKYIDALSATMKNSIAQLEVKSEAKLAYQKRM